LGESWIECVLLTKGLYVTVIVFAYALKHEEIESRVPCTKKIGSDLESHLPPPQKLPTIFRARLPITSGYLSGIVDSFSQYSQVMAMVTE
jgi:hypothetical protein